MAHLPAVMMRIPMCCHNQDRVISPGPCGSPSRDARADRSWAAIRHLRTRGSRYPASGGSCLNGGIPAVVIVSPLKEIQRCLFVNSMHLRETGHGSLLPVDQAGAIRVDSLCRRRLRTRLSPIIKVYAHLTVPSREYDTDRRAATIIASTSPPTIRGCAPPSARRWPLLPSMQWQRLRDDYLHARRKSRKRQPHRRLPRRV